MIFQRQMFEQKSVNICALLLTSNKLMIV